MIQIINSQNLIGDLCGTVPLMIDLAKIYGRLEVFQTLNEGKWVYPMLEKHNIHLVDEVSDDAKELDIERAFAYSMDTGLYMTSCWHEQFGFITTIPSPRPDLDIPDVEVPVYDYVFAPFSRSTPEDQKWPMENWENISLKLTNEGYKVGILGNSKFDKLATFYGAIYTQEFDRPMGEVLNIIKKCRNGCVSINTGISHLCYATGTKNYLLNNQGQGWAVQPDAISIETYIPRITVEEMLEFIKNN